MPRIDFEAARGRWGAAVVADLVSFNAAADLTNQFGTESAAAQAKPIEAGLFSVPADQMAHLKVITVGTTVWANFGDHHGHGRLGC